MSSSARRLRTSHDPCRNDRGSALVIALLVILLLSVVGAIIVMSSTVQTRLSGVDQRRGKALDLAEAGVSEAVSRIRSGEVPGNGNPRMVAQIFLANAGSVPVLGPDSIGLATAQPAGNWLKYSTETRSPSTLTIRYRTDASRSAIYKYDVTQSLPIQTASGLPIYQIISTGTVGNVSRRLVVDVVAEPINLSIKGALATKVGVKFTGNAFACGFNHRMDTPYGTGTDGRAGSGGCNEDPSIHHWEVGSDDLAGIWSGESINSGGASSRDGNPPELSGQTGFYLGPWDALGMSQAQFFALTGPRQSSIPADLDDNIYLDNNDVTQDQSGSYTVHGTGAGLLYVDGDLTMNAGFTYRGLVYVEGDVKLNGDAWVLGALIVKGVTEVKFNGGATILYSPDAIRQNISRGSRMNSVAWHEVDL